MLASISFADRWSVLAYLTLGKRLATGEESDKHHWEYRAAGWRARAADTEVGNGADRSSFRLMCPLMRLSGGK
jgi:hypothetical protein